jgi:L-iditol 2-dehydrogenase
VTARLIHVCGKCYYCRSNRENMCAEMNNLDNPDLEIFGTGGLGEYLNVKTSQVYRMPDGLPHERILFAEPLACVVNSIEQGEIELGDDAVVIGAGIMGMLHVLCAKRKGARVIVSEPDEARRRLALRLGADVAFDPLAEDAVAFVKNLTGGRGAEAVFNTTPVAAVAEQAVAMTGYRGRCVMYSSMHPDKPIGISPNWLHKSEAVITGAVSPTVRSFFRSANLIAKGLVDTEQLISGVYGYEEANEAFEAALRPDTYRIIIRSDR